MTFTFCGYAFRPRMAFDKNRKQVYTGFLPAVAPEKLTEMSARSHPGGSTGARLRHSAKSHDG